MYIYETYYFYVNLLIIKPSQLCLYTKKKKEREKNYYMMLLFFYIYIFSNLKKNYDCCLYKIKIFDKNDLTSLLIIVFLLLNDKN
jgi:hypothetical protein